jgi:hypothetical protein
MWPIEDLHGGFGIVWQNMTGVCYLHVQSQQLEHTFLHNNTLDTNMPGIFDDI